MAIFVLVTCREISRKVGSTRLLVRRWKRIHRLASVWRGVVLRRMIAISVRMRRSSVKRVLESGSRPTWTRGEGILMMTAKNALVSLQCATKSAGHWNHICGGRMCWKRLELIPDLSSRELIWRSMIRIGGAVITMSRQRESCHGFWVRRI